MSDNMTDQTMDMSTDEAPVFSQPTQSQPFFHPQPPGVAVTPGPLDVEAANQEIAKLNEIQSQMNAGVYNPVTDDEKRDIDARLIYIGNVEYLSTIEELMEIFVTVGNVDKITIMTNKATGTPKGFAYLTYEDELSLARAVATLDGTLLHDRALKVSPKRKNIPGISTSDRGFRGRGAFRGRGGRGGRGAPRGGRGRGAPRGRGRFLPY